MNPDIASVSTDTALQIVANRRRRTLLMQLRDNEDGGVALRELTERIVQEESAASSPFDADHDRIAIELHHDHLPKLSDAGILTYDADTQMVWYFGTDRVERLLEFVSLELE